MRSCEKAFLVRSEVHSGLLSLLWRSLFETLLIDLDLAGGLDVPEGGAVEDGCDRLLSRLVGIKEDVDTELLFWCQVREPVRDAEDHEESTFTITTFISRIKLENLSILQLKLRFDHHYSLLKCAGFTFASFASSAASLTFDNSYLLCCFLYLFFMIISPDDI